MMLPWWHPFDIPLLFDTLSEEAVMRWFSNRHFLGFFFYTRRPTWLSSYRKCIKHELKLMKSNLHWLGQRMWMLFILYQTTQRSTLLLPNSRKWHPKGHWGFWIQCANEHMLGAGFLTYVGMWRYEGGVRTMSSKEKRGGVSWALTTWQARC